LGTGDYEKKFSPVTLKINNITEISPGLIHCLLLNNIGEVYSFGGNYVIFLLIQEW
jgi:alpha-tubulin suppressor-like RCC1 family protein